MILKTKMNGKKKKETKNEKKKQKRKRKNALWSANKKNTNNAKDNELTN